MAGVYKLEITKTEADLKQLLRTQKTASDKERLQLLYLLKTEQATTIQAAAALLVVTASPCRHGDASTAVVVWKQCKHTPRSGRQPSIPQWAQEALNKRLHQSAGFERYNEICQWLETQLGISAPDKTVHQLVPYRLQASPKVARPVSVANADERVEAYKKTR